MGEKSLSSSTAGGHFLSVRKIENEVLKIEDNSFVPNSNFVSLVESTDTKMPP